MKENWVKIYEVNDYKINTSIWLEELLKRDNIPYKNEIEEYWVGIRIPKYRQKLKVFIPQKYKNIVQKYIKKYENPKLVDSQNVEELKNVNDDENNVEIKKYNKIKNRFFKYYICFLIIVVILIIIAIIIN